MSPRMGRPKAENPKVDRYIIRATADTSKKIDELSAHYGKSKAEIFRMGIERLYAEMKK